MCVAYPGTVIRIQESKRTATVDFNGTTLEAQTGFTRVKPGDHVLVHAGCVLQVLTESDAMAIEEIFNDIAELDQEEKPYEKDLARMKAREENDASDKS